MLSFRTVQLHWYTIKRNSVLISLFQVKGHCSGIFNAELYYSMVIFNGDVTIRWMVYLFYITWPCIIQSNDNNLQWCYIIHSIYFSCIWSAFLNLHVGSGRMFNSTYALGVGRRSDWNLRRRIQKERHQFRKTSEIHHQSRSQGRSVREKMNI